MYRVLFYNVNEVKTMNNINDFVIVNGVLKQYKDKDEKVVIPESVVALRPQTFARSDINVKEVIIPDGVTEIPDECFYDCKFIETIKLPESIKAIGRKAFWNCKELKEINMPKELVIISEAAFGNCSKLSDINFFDSLEVIEERAFDSCHELTVIDFSKSLIKIGRWFSTDVLILKK